MLQHTCTAGKAPPQWTKQAQRGQQPAASTTAITQALTQMLTKTTAHNLSEAYAITIKIYHAPGPKQMVQHNKGTTHTTFLLHKTADVVGCSYTHVTERRKNHCLICSCPSFPNF